MVVDLVPIEAEVAMVAVIEAEVDVDMEGPLFSVRFATSLVMMQVIAIFV
jgi:hypothetical protein